MSRCALNLQNKETTGALKIAQTVEGKRQLRNEMHILQMLQHVNIVRILAIVQEEGLSEHGMVLEWMECDLFDFVNDKYCSMDDAKWYETTLRLSCGLLDGVTYLHDRKVCHRDIKLENLMCDYGGTMLKIVDFGLASHMEVDGRVKGSRGSLAYVAPEVVGWTPYDGAAADVWSCGVVVVALLTMSWLYESPGDELFMDLLEKGITQCVTDRFTGRPRFSLVCQMLPCLTHLLAQDPTARSVQEARVAVSRESSRLSLGKASADRVATVEEVSYCA